MAKHRYWRLFMANSYFPDSSGGGGIYANMFIGLAKVMFREGLDVLPIDRQMVLDGSYCPGVATASSTGTPLGNMVVHPGYLFGSTQQFGNFGGDYTELGADNPRYGWNSAVGSASNPYSGVTNQWVQYDYTSNSALWPDVNIITLVSHNDAVAARQSLANMRMPKDCKVQWSDNGTTWTDHFSFTFEQKGQGVHQTFYHPSVQPRTVGRTKWTVEMTYPLNWIQSNQAGDPQIGIWLENGDPTDQRVTNVIHGTSSSPIFRYHTDKYVGRDATNKVGFLPGSTGTKMIIQSEADIALSHLSLPRLYVTGNNPTYPSMTWPRYYTIQVVISNNVEGETSRHLLQWSSAAQTNDWDGLIVPAYKRDHTLVVT